MANVLAVILLFFSASAFAVTIPTITPTTLNLGTAAANLPALLPASSALRTLAPLVPAVRVGAVAWSIAELALPLLYPPDNLPAVPNWTDPNAPPNSYTSPLMYSVDLIDYYATPQAACDAYFKIWNAGQPAGVWRTYTVSGSSCRIQQISNNSVQVYTSWESRYVCLKPAYSYDPLYNQNYESPQTCTLRPAYAASAKWPSDGQPTYVPSTTTDGEFVVHPRDPDTAPAKSGIIQDGIDEYGTPVKQQILPTKDGKIQIKQQVETSDPEGNTQVQTRTIDLDRAGQIIKIVTSVAPNTSLNSAPPPTVTQTPLEFPLFCVWAVVVCDFIDWFQTDTPPPVQPELPVVDIELPSYDSGLSAGSCPSDVSTSFQGQSITFPFANACWAASNVFKPIMLLIAGIAAVFIVTGARSI